MISQEQQKKNIENQKHFTNFFFTFPCLNNRFWIYSWYSSLIFACVCAINWKSDEILDDTHDTQTHMKTQNENEEF